MNDMPHDDGPAREPSGLDPELLQLFDRASSVSTEDEAFVRVVLVKLRRARRRRLLARWTTTTAIIVSGALLAPHVAQATLTIADWVTLYYPVGCVCAALIAWRIARRGFN
jgi:hypothetical protein